MMGFDSPDHLHLSEELLVDCGYTKVIASRVGALGTSIVRAAKPGDFTRANREKPKRDESSVPRFPSGKPREFTLAELQKATANFSDKRLLGRGGFGKVYRGILSDGAVVAVKVLGKDSVQGLEQFQTEMRVSCAIMGISHPNLVPAIGYHSSRKRKMAKIMIVYPFMVRGDVRHYLGDLQPSQNSLDWPTRKRIALGVARGICSLHELGIVHGDIKPANVMLDEDFNAHVGDLGLAKSTDLPLNSYNAAWFHGDEDSHLGDTTRIYGTPRYVAPESHHGDTTRIYGTPGYVAPESHLGYTTRIYGTPGYVAPESHLGDTTRIYGTPGYVAPESHLGDTTRIYGTPAYVAPEYPIHSRHSRKTDVFAFGVTLIQIITGKNAFDLPAEDGSKIPVSYARQLLKKEEDLTRLMHSWILGVYDESEAIELIQLGLVCVQRDPRERPLMPEVIAIMEGSSTTLKQRWDNYDSTWRYWRQLSSDKLSETECYLRSFYSVISSGSEVRDDEDVCCSYEVDANEEELEENADDSKQLRRAEDFPSEDSNKEHQVRLTSSAISRSQENDSLAEIVEVDQNERGISKQLSSQANRHEGASDEAATKLREMLDQLREVELKHQATMEEIHQKQIALMQSMIKIQGEYIQKVNEMQSQIDQLKGVPQKP